MRFFNYILLLLSVFLSACSSGGGDSSVAPAPTFTWSPGIYAGTFTQTGSAPDNVVLLVTSDNRFALANTNGMEYAIGTVSGANLSVDGFVATLNAALSGTYIAPGITGTFALTDTGLYNRTSSTTKLEGVWVDSVYTSNSGTTTLVIDSAGSVQMSSISGCSGTGQFSTINSSKNEYNFTLLVTNCTGYDGTYNGLAVTDDTNFTDDTIDIIAENLTAQTFIISAPIKQ